MLLTGIQDELSQQDCPQSHKIPAIACARDNSLVGAEYNRQSVSR